MVDGAASASSHAITIPAGGGSGSDRPASPPPATTGPPPPLPPIDWAATAFLEGLGAVPWFAPPTPEWRGPPVPGPAPVAVLPPLETGGDGAEPGPDAPCVAAVAVDAPGGLPVRQPARGGRGRHHAVGLVSITLGGRGGPAARPPTTSPPYTLVIRPPPGSAYTTLRALAGAVDGALAPGGAALVASVADPWATMWPGRGGGAVSVVALLEAKAGGNATASASSLAAALTPGAVSVAGRACRVEAAAPRRTGADGAVDGSVPSLMQVAFAGAGKAG
jgi:hypothetical protein